MTGREKLRESRGSRMTILYEEGDGIKGEKIENYQMTSTSFNSPISPSSVSNA